MSRHLRLEFDAASWQPDHVEVIASDGISRTTIDVSARNLSLPFADDAFSTIEGGDVLRYVPEPLAFMQELHRIACASCTASFILPDISSDDAYSPAFLTRPYTPVSFIYFGQPAYRRADYNYRGDWIIVEAIYIVRRQRYEGASIARVKAALERERNQALCFLINLSAVKPIRLPTERLPQIDPKIVLA
jgi:hypothetical protein